MNIAILGSGNIGLSLANGLVKSDYCKAGQITLTRRNISNLSDYTEQGYRVTADNHGAVEEASVVILAVLPQQLDKLLDEIRAGIKAPHLIISVISGVTCGAIRGKLGGQVQVIRAMPNTAISIGQSMT